MTPVTSPRDLATAQSNVRFRELGLYELPDGREYVVSTLYSDGFSLYDARSWGSFGNAEYRVNKQGQLLRYGSPTLLTTRDLKDTGRTMRYPKPNIK
jgi:hypothetical protein